MNTNLLTINNMLFAGTTLAPPIGPKPAPYSNSALISPDADTANASSNTTESKTTDNIYDTTQDVPINKPRQDFNDTLQNAVKNQSPQQDQTNSNKVNNDKVNKNGLNKNHDEQNSISEASSKTEPAQSEPTQEVPFTLEVLVKENSAKIESKTSSQFPQLIANLKDGKPQKDSESLLLTQKAEKSAETKLPVTTNKEQIVPKTVISNSSKNLDKLQTNSSEIPENTPISDKKTTNDQDNNTQVLNETILNTKILPNRQTTEEPVSDTFVDTDSSKTTPNEKLPILETSIVTDKTQSPKSINKQIDTDTLKVDETKTEKENSALTDKSVFQTNEKTPVPNTSFSETHTQNKIIEQNSQSNGIIPEKSIPNTNKTLENTSESKTTEPEIISESSSSENKETLNSENKLSENDAVKELNILDVQVSTGQTKNNNSTASDNNSNSEFEQILVQNNPQASATEQSAGSADTAKTLDMPTQTSPANPTTDASKQVFESIQSSFSQQHRNQQITVQLNPPELGKVSIKFQEQDEQITGLLEVSKTQTRIEIEQAIPQILRGLQDSGIQIKRLDVVLTQEQDEQPGQEALRDQTMQNSFSHQQQGTADSYTGSNNPDADEINKWLINNNNRYRNISELQESFSANDSIDMLA